MSDWFEFELEAKHGTDERINISGPFSLWRDKNTPACYIELESDWQGDTETGFGASISVPFDIEELGQIIEQLVQCRAILILRRENQHTEQEADGGD